MGNKEVMWMVSEDFIIRLQAMNASGELEGYICSQISSVKLESDWIIQGLTHNGLSGQIDSDKNRKQFLMPMDSAIRLMIDEGLDPTSGLGIVILGSQGLTERKFVVLLRGCSQHLEALAFQITSGYNPQDIIRLIIKYELNEELSTTFIEPFLDYIEQLRYDSSEGDIVEALSLSIPKGKFNLPEWIRDASMHEDSQNLLFRYGELKQVPPFALLFASWCLGLDSQKSIRNRIVSMTLIGEKSKRIAMWDGPRGISSFAIYKTLLFEEIARKYFLALWSSGQEKLSPPVKTREVIVSPGKKVTKEKEDIPPDQYDMKTHADFVELKDTIDHIRQKLDEFSISELLIRLEDIESQLSTQTDVAPTLHRDETRIIDPQIHERLKVVIARLEEIARRLEELETRIGRISSKNLE